ncbi:hypothetical protein ACFLQI_00490 [Candidatus Undinarchaeota archaeon]
MEPKAAQIMLIKAFKANVMAGGQQDELDVIELKEDSVLALPVEDELLLLTPVKDQVKLKEMNQEKLQGCQPIDILEC